MSATAKNYDTPFDIALRKAGLRQIDMARLTGLARQTVWNWRSGAGKHAVPEYAWTIVRLQKRVRELTAAACA